MENILLIKKSLYKDQALFMVEISILLPTRGRPFLVQRLLKSITHTTSDLVNIEVILYIDEDDVVSHEITHPSITLVKIIMPPGNSMGNITRECYKASSGRYIMLMNDDVVFHTQNWDIAVISAFRNFHDDIALVYGNDLDQSEHVPTFPILSRKVCELMGGITPIGYQNLHLESHIFDIFKQLKKLGFNRVVYLNDIIFEHLHYIVGKSEYDRTYIKKNPFADHQLFIDLDGDRSYIARRLAQYIDNGIDIQIESPIKNIEKGDISHDEINRVPLVSIVIPVFYDDIETSYRCFDAIVNVNTDQTPFEVVLVSSRSSCLLFSSYLANLKEVKIVNDKENSNFARMCNQGAKEARGDYIIFINNLVVPQSGWIDVMIRTIERNYDIGVVGCKQLNPRNGRVYHIGVSFFNTLGRLSITNIYRGLKSDNPAVNKLREFQAINGRGCMLVKKKTFWEIGGFDEIPDCIAAIDLCFKMREQGKKVIYIPEATVYQYGNGISDKYDMNLSFIESKWGEKIKNDLDSFLSEDGFFLHKTDNTYYIDTR